mgnify:CR=1 FL=1
MDSYFAAIEIRDHPQWKGHPLAVGGTGPRSVVSTASYEARKYGVHSALPMSQALRKCPHLIMAKSRFSVYKATTKIIQSIFREYTDKIEPMSLDEAYLDVSHQNRYAWDLAKEIRQKIFEKTQLTASAGIAPNKMLAKIASDWNKPNGQFAVTPDQIESFMKKLPVEKIPGVGKRSQERLSQEGIHSCEDLQQWPKWKLKSVFGKWGMELYFRCRGIDERPVESHYERKSLSNEQTYDHDLGTLEECCEALNKLFDELLIDIRKHASNKKINRAVVKVKFSNFKSTTCECPCKTPIWSIYEELLKKAYARSPHKVRLLGTGVRFATEKSSHKAQMELFEDIEKIK